MSDKKDERRAVTIPLSMYFEPDLLDAINEAWHNARARNRNEWIKQVLRDHLESLARKAGKKG